jgi:hypothetical protein
VAGCEEDGLYQLMLLFDWPKSRQKALANFKLVPRDLGELKHKIRRVRLHRTMEINNLLLPWRAQRSLCKILSEPKDLVFTKTSPRVYFAQALFSRLFGAFKKALKV